MIALNSFGLRSLISLTSHRAVGERIERKRTDRKSFANNARATHRRRPYE
jgi:hypothetical protein